MGLTRSLRQRDLVAVTINAIIGAGIFGLPGRIFALAGPWSLLACVTCGAFACLIVLCFAEVGSRFRDTGGPYLYARKAFGDTVGFDIGSLMWLARVSAFAANANLLLTYLGTFGIHWEAGTSRTVFLAMVVGALAIVNLLGIRNAALLNHLFTFGKLAPLAVFIALGSFAVVPQRLALGQAPPLADFSAAVLLLVYAFTGFEMGTVPTGEMKNPERTLPRALLTAIGIVAFVYISLQAVCIGVLPALATSARPLADASRVFLGEAGMRMIVAGIVVSILGNLHITILSASRIPFAMAEQGQLPPVFKHLHARFGSPDFAIVTTSLVMLAMTLGATFLGAVSISTVARLLVYMSTCAALPKLRRHGENASFKIRGGVAIAGVALVVSVWLLAHAPAAEWRAVAVVAAVATVFQFAFKRRVQGMGR